MPLTYDPQARLNTALRRVLFHIRHFVADRRRTLQMLRMSLGAPIALPHLPFALRRQAYSRLFVDTLDPLSTSSSLCQGLSRPSYLVGQARWPHGLDFRLALSSCFSLPSDLPEQDQVQGSTCVPQATCVPQDPLG
ncbi:hypothetical protein EV715DRAFT_276409 [Schizophyllum commune]